MITRKGEDGFLPLLFQEISARKSISAAEDKITVNVKEMTSFVLNSKNSKSFKRTPLSVPFGFKVKLLKNLFTIEDGNFKEKRFWPKYLECTDNHCRTVSDFVYCVN